MNIKKITAQKFVEIRSHQIAAELAKALQHDAEASCRYLPGRLVQLIHARALVIMLCAVTGQNKNPEELLREIENRPDRDVNLN